MSAADARFVKVRRGIRSGSDWFDGRENCLAVEKPALKALKQIEVELAGLARVADACSAFVNVTSFWRQPEEARPEFEALVTALVDLSRVRAST